MLEPFDVDHWQRRVVVPHRRGGPFEDVVVEAGHVFVDIGLALVVVVKDVVVIIEVVLIVHFCCTTSGRVGISSSTSKKVLAAIQIVLHD